MQPNPPTLSPRFARAVFFAWFGITASWWALAFAPLPVPEPWLAQARAVCFGTTPDGLPDSWGWILLILAPLSMLTFLLAVWGRDLAVGLDRMTRGLGGRLVLGAVLAIAMWGVISVGGRVLAVEQIARAGLSVADGPLPATIVRETDPAPPLSLIDQHGRRFDLTALAGRPVLVTFAYGHCATVCPALVSTLARAADAHPGTPPPSVIVTLDPWRDTPSALPSLFRAWQLDRIDNAYLLSGPVDQVMATIDAWGVGISRDTRTGDIAHPGLIFVIDTEGRLAHRFLNPPANWLVEVSLALERESELGPENSETTAARS